MKTSEYVLYGHPDKIADSIADAILDRVLAQDPQGRCAAEVLVTSPYVVVAGELQAQSGNFNLEELVRRTLVSLGYSDSSLGFSAFSCKIINLLRVQSPELSRLQAVGPAVAGDQGLMTGYATNESPDYLPLQHSVARYLLYRLASLDLPEVFTDAKSLVSLDFPDSDIPRFRVADISIHSTRKDLKELSAGLLEDLRKEYLGYLNVPTFAKINFNPAGPFTVGGPAGDTGLTGRKIVVDSYGEEIPVGGGAFSGKDPTKVDRSAAYYARYVAKNLVAAGVCKKALVRVSYMIGQDGPKSVSLDTFGTNTTKMSDQKLIDILLKKNVFDFRVDKIITSLELRNPIYSPTSRFGHFGIESFVQKISTSTGIKDVTFFPWEKLDRVSDIQKALN